MPADGRQLLEAYRHVDAALVAKGAPPTSPTWLEALESFWLSGCFRMVVRKGRQVGASTIIAPRITATTALFGDFTQARGTRGTIGFSSTRQKEADERLYNIERCFFDLGVKVKQRGDTIEVPKLHVIIQSFPATSDVARGANAWMWWEDEMPAWRDGDGINPSSERDATIVPACAMHINARIYSVGTPMGRKDYHASLIERGDTDGQRAFVGPSWYWNPTLTEARTRELEPDERRHAREFGAIPLEADGESIFTASAIDRCTRDDAIDLPREEGTVYVAAMDPAMSRNSWTFCIACKRWVGGRVVWSVVAIRQWTRPAGSTLDPFEVLREIKQLCDKYGVTEVASDQHHGTSLQAIGWRPEVGIHVEVVPATQTTNLARYESMLTHLNSGEADLPRDPFVRADLLAVRRVPLNTGGLRIELERDGARHADYAPAISHALERCLYEPTLPKDARTTDAERVAALWAPIEQEVRAAERQELEERYGGDYYEMIADRISRLP